MNGDVRTAALAPVARVKGILAADVTPVRLNAINRLPQPKPWIISFSYGRALQDRALQIWAGRDESLAAGRQAMAHRAHCNSGPSHGTYTDEVEAMPL